MDETWTTGLKRIEQALLDLDAVPQLGSLPPFPYEALTGNLQAQFDLPSLTITEEWSRWTPAEQALKDLGDPLTHLTFACPPLEGELFFTLSVQSLQSLMHTLLGGDANAAALYDSDLREGFSQFLTATILKACQETGYPLTPRLITKKPLPSTPLFVRQITINDLPARLLLTDTLAAQIRTHFEEAKMLTPEIAQSLPVELSIIAGETELSAQEWESLKAGDFISLDTCTVDPSKMGPITLNLDASPLLTGEINTEGVTVTGLSG